MLMCVFFFCKQKTAYELRISDGSSDVCSSDLNARNGGWVEALSVPVNNPFRAQLFPGQPITVGYSFIDDFGPSTIDGDVETYGAVLNASWQIDDNWQIRTYAQYARNENVFLKDRKSTRLNSSH